MYIVRLDYQNGLHKEYCYGDIGIATKNFDLASLARNKGCGLEIDDEAGRKASVDGGKLQSVELVDLQAEAISGIKVVSEVQAIQKEFGFGQQRLPQPEPMTRDEEPEYRPAIGSRGKFAS